MSRCGRVATRRGKQTSGTSLEAMCDRASVWKTVQGPVTDWNDVIARGGPHGFRFYLLIHINNNQERCSWVTVSCVTTGKLAHTSIQWCTVNPELMQRPPISPATDACFCLSIHILIAHSYVLSYEDWEQIQAQYSVCVDLTPRQA